jgi:hypothetical protein
MPPRFRMNLGYEAPNLGDGPSEPDPHAAMEMATCRWVGDKLEREYPGHAWDVRCEQGIVRFQLRHLMPSDAWYVVKLSDLSSDPGGRRTVLRGAGELLERYNLPRRGFSVDDWRIALNKMPIKGRGHHEPLR